MKRWAAALLALLFAAPQLRAGSAQDKVIDVRAARPAAGNSFEAMWGAYRKADLAGDAESATSSSRRSGGPASNATSGAWKTSPWHSSRGVRSGSGTATVRAPRKIS